VSDRAVRAAAVSQGGTHPRRMGYTRHGVSAGNQLQHNVPDAHLAKRSQVTFGPMTIDHLPVTLGIQVGM
jgi:hypothetical protein